MLLGPGRMEGRGFELSSLRYAYVPLGVYASLAFAAHRPDEPVRTRALVVGLAGVVAFVLVSFAVTVGRMAMREAMPPGQAPGALGTAVELAYRVLVNAPAFEYVVPGFIWLFAHALGLPDRVQPSRAEQRRRAAR
jgi:hypothetical protein